MIVTTFVPYLTILVHMHTLVQSSPTDFFGTSKAEHVKRYPINIQCSDNTEQMKIIRDLNLLAHYAQGPLDWLQNSFDADTNL